MSEPVVLAPGAGETIEGPVGGPLTFKLRGEQSDGRLAVFENVIPPGEGPPLHTHANEDEAFYVLEGEFRYRLGGETHAAPAGSFAFIPRDVPHCFQNVGEVPARLLVMFTPAGMERFFDQFAALPAGGAAGAAFASVGREFEMEVLGPPLR
jgi:quercetin dioxygenase-like cupin family protein